MRANDKRLHRTLCRILKELIRTEDPAAGTGKPGALKHHLSGLCSRRLSQKNRLIYRFSDNAIYIFAIAGHYNH
jgi:toxin YoeB